MEAGCSARSLCLAGHGRGDQTGVRRALERCVVLALRLAEAATSGTGASVKTVSL
jgi:hypothetical protein